MDTEPTDSVDAEEFGIFSPERRIEKQKAAERYLSDILPSSSIVQSTGHQANADCLASNRAELDWADFLPPFPLQDNFSSHCNLFDNRHLRIKANPPRFPASKIGYSCLGYNVFHAAVIGTGRK